MPTVDRKTSFGLFLIMVRLMLISAQDPYCLTRPYCGNHDDRSVAPCVRHEDRRKAHCDTEPLSSYYIYHNCRPMTCVVTEKNHCKNSPCKNNGKCLTMFGSYSCECTNNFHGRNCDESSSIDMRTVKGVYFMFNTYTVTRKNQLLQIYIRETGDDMRIVFDTGDSGEVIKIKKAHMTELRGKQKCEGGKKRRSCNHLPEGNMFYLSVPFDVVYTLEGSVIMEHYPKENIPVPGFKINHLSIKVYNKMSEEFSEVFNQLVAYRNDFCSVEVVITQNCGSRSDKPLRLSRKTEMVINSIMKKNAITEEECPNQIVDYNWDIYEIGTQFSISSISPKKSKHGQAEYNIEKFTMKYGLYKVKLTVHLSGITNTLKYNTNSIGICYFEIAKVPLEVKIQGGDSKSVSRNEYFVLDASQSYDPNEPKDKQSHLKWQWKCDRTEDICKPRLFNSGIYEFPNGLPEGTWKFTLTLKTIDASNTPVTTSQTIVSSEFPHVQIYISCLKNCGITDFKTNPKEVVYLEAIVRNSVNLNAFMWTYYVDDNIEELSANDISQDSVKSNILVIKENVLKQGSKYTFIVRPADEIFKGSSSITIDVNKPPEGGSCSVSPERGQKAVTEFFIKCVNFSNLDNAITQLSYECYQKENEDDHPGTMLGHSISGELDNVILTHNYITVRVIGAHGMYTDVSLSVTLESWEPTIQNIDSMMSNITLLRLSGDYSSSVRIAGAIMDVIKNVTDKLTVIKFVLENLTLGKIHDFSDVKMFTLVLKKVVNVGVQQLANGIDGETVQSMGKLMALLAKSVVNHVTNTDKKRGVIIVDDIKSITQTMLECTDVIVNSNDNVITDPSSSNRAMFASHDQYKKGTANMINALYSSGVAVLTRLLPHENEIVMKANYSMMWLKVEDPDILTNMAIPPNITTNIKIKTQLAKLLKSKYKYVDVMVSVFNKNPYWWDLQETDLASEIISVNVWDRSRRQQLVSKISAPLDIYFEIKNTLRKTISGHVKLPGLKDSQDYKDSSVAVHILEAPPENSNGKLFVEFFNLQESEFRVLISVNIRPDYDLMMTNAQVVSSRSSKISLSYTNIYESTLHFIGILPGENVAENKTASYTFHIYSIQCKLRHVTVWTSPDCIIGEETSQDKVHCKCSHMSFFGSSIFVAPNTVHPIKDLYLLMTLKDNPLVFTIVVSLLLIYMILLTWIKTRDKRDKFKRKVIVLDDNFPGEQYSYLIVVFTAFSFGSGTRSNVGIKLIGSESRSRAHILRSRTRKVFRRNADDWFLLFTNTHLGDLKAVHFWHDNSGSKPDWCCRKVHVYDMTTRRRYTFMVEQWLSVRLGEYPEAVIQALGPGERYGWKQIVIHNLVYHLQENHLWASVFICHPRATVSKSQRLTVTFSVIFITFFTGIMFYGVAKGHISEDEPRYVIKYREIMVTIQSIIISGVVSSVIVRCFRKSNNILMSKRENHESKIFLQLNENRKTENKKQEYVVLRFLTQVLYSVVKGKPMMPILVGVESYTSVVRRRKWLKVGWVLSQITIWTSAYFIILHGLKLGKVKSKLWVTAAVFNFCQGAFVSAPLKIVVFSTLLAALGEMYNVDTYECDILAAMQSEYLGNRHVLNNILAIRASPEYQPLSLKRVVELRNLYLRRENVFNKLDFLVTLLFLLILINFTRSFCIGRHFYLNSHISISLTKSFRRHEPSLEEVNDLKELINFLVINWIPNLFKGRWYNKRMNLTSVDESLPETGWFMDATHRMIGIPRLRQVRVKGDYCPSFTFNEIDIMIYCFPHLTKSTLDINSYGFTWNPVSKNVNKPLLVPWTYQTSNDYYIMYGQSGTAYQSGGYIALLKDTQRASASIISDLRNLKWWDVRLRVLFSEVNLYNPNTNTYTAVIIISEYLPSSAVTNKIITCTVQTELNIPSTLLFLCILSFLNVRLICIFNRQGVFETLSTVWGFYDFVLVLTSNICILFHWLKIYENINITEALKQVSNDDFAQFYKIIYLQGVSKVLWCLLFCLAPVRILTFDFVFYLCRTSYRTIYRSKSSLIAVSVVLLMVISAEGILLNFIICPESKALHNSRYFYTENILASNCKYNLKCISHVLAVTSGLAIMIIQIVLINRYKSTKSVYENKI